MAHISNFTVGAYLGLFTIEIKVVGDRQMYFAGSESVLSLLAVGTRRPQVEIPFTFPFSYILNRSQEICRSLRNGSSKETTGSDSDQKERIRGFRFMNLTESESI
ncbi:hypothetical protein AVEN_137895-1 [Araneus ventricosus]|uniref:Uncharacterized protein n=1 Tax=Araneus ventricosus TaxID=182803 RepID=A0A4Y2WPY5_ARAVE|nr:hypothetical protein AVEN_137895-1 [Araneus ventricosus]